MLETDASTSYRMRLVKTSNTAIEVRVRSLFHKLGYRFAIKNYDLPGKPDIILPKFETVVFVHGCFWHGHDKCSKGTLRPKRNVEFWHNKIIYNKKRDQTNCSKLKKLGWKVFIIWECELSNTAKLIKRIKRYFSRNANL